MPGFGAVARRCASASRSTQPLFIARSATGRRITPLSRWRAARPPAGAARPIGAPRSRRASVIDRLLEPGLAAGRGGDSVRSAPRRAGRRLAHGRAPPRGGSGCGGAAALPARMRGCGVAARSRRRLGSASRRQARAVRPLRRAAIERRRLSAIRHEAAVRRVSCMHAPAAPFVARARARLRRPPRRPRRRRRRSPSRCCGSPRSRRCRPHLAGSSPASFAVISPARHPPRLRRNVSAVASPDGRGCAVRGSRRHCVRRRRRRRRGRPPPSPGVCSPVAVAAVSRFAASSPSSSLRRLLRGRPLPRAAPRLRLGLLGERLGRFERMHLLAAIDDESLRRGQRLVGIDGDGDGEALFQRAQMRALVVEHIERDRRGACAR